VAERAAIKLMRMDKVDYSLPLFREEVQILSLLKDISGVTRLLECGFVRLDLGEAQQFPLDSAIEKIQALGGDLLRIGVDTASRFLDQLNSRVQDGWTPYLALEEQNQTNNLLRMCDAGLNRGQFLPVAQLVQMAIQICDILEIAHAHQIVYRDHKILHYYWLSESNGIYIIDWNVARYHPEGLSEVEIHMDLVQFGARGLHHILTGRAAPGALPLGPTRPEEIEQAAQSYRPQWTYDDQRLPEEIKEILERVLAGGYSSAAGLRDDLKRAYMQYPNA
jgi:serine/threonine protein kinase